VGHWGLHDCVSICIHGARRAPFARPCDEGSRAWYTYLTSCASDAALLYISTKEKEKEMSSSWMEFKAELIAQYQQQKQMADAALGRVDDAAFFARLSEGGDDHANSIAILVKHI